MDTYGMIIALGGMLVLGIAIGLRLAAMLDDKKKIHYTGAIVLNTKDPDKDIARIELYVPIMELFDANSISLEVKCED